MWNVTKEARLKFEKCNLLPIHESDEEWEMALRDAELEGEDIQARLKEELEEVKDDLLHVLPSRFIPYLENGTLNQPTLPKVVREDYLDWVRKNSLEFEQKLDAAYKNTQNAVTYLPNNIQEIFEESLHDATIERIEREDQTLHLFMNTDGGFSTKSIIHLLFKNVLTEEANVPIQTDQWLIYYELQKTDEGFAFRVLFDVPDTEWTITMQEMDGEYYYRPSIYTILRDEEKLEMTSITEYISGLNLKHRYWFITPDVICYINSMEDSIELENGKIEFRLNDFIINIGNESYTYNRKEFNPVDFIYTDTYEDPYGYFEELLLPVEDKEAIEAAVLGDNLELQVSAWNTMYEHPKELADSINLVLSKMVITDENEMMLSVFVNAFYQEGILQDDIAKKYQSLLD
ncbi:DUF4085 family protein [Paucisalibacillus sp. EB02]|uniref:DUF4085 family protein n=1 Tax=Paucisalibacillus sp. EB02 TaxID=1347087 RepID=UPI0005AA93F2|nr:DUF4085 family protein [Paucisalibacillus sp. EB02]